MTGVTPLPRSSHFSFTCDGRHMVVTGVTPFCMAVAYSLLRSASLHHCLSSFIISFSSKTTLTTLFGHPILPLCHPSYQPIFLLLQATLPLHFSAKSSINRAPSIPFHTPTYIPIYPKNLPKLLLASLHKKSHTHLKTHSPQISLQVCHFLPKPRRRRIATSFLHTTSNYPL